MSSGGGVLTHPLVCRTMSNTGLVCVCSKMAVWWRCVGQQGHMLLVLVAERV